MSAVTAHDERGDETIEAVLVTPVLLLLIMVVIQFGLWYHASHVAEAAAQQGASVARVEAATAADGRTSAQQFMADCRSRARRSRHRHRRPVTANSPESPSTGPSTRSFPD